MAISWSVCSLQSSYSDADHFDLRHSCGEKLCHTLSEVESPHVKISRMPGLLPFSICLPRVSRGLPTLMMCGNVLQNSVHELTVRMTSSSKCPVRLTRRRGTERRGCVRKLLVLIIHDCSRVIELVIRTLEHNQQVFSLFVCQHFPRVVSSTT